ncbi:MAG: hypothetical protein KDH20_04415 [Rhodocyclaceae bacterium]|nr:hypothetical protein [Rhodocyclaceae bacterium]
MSPLRRIQPEEISARAPLPFAVFDKAGHQLYGRGVVIGSIGYTQFLLARGLYRNDAADTPRQDPATTD